MPAMTQLAAPVPRPLHQALDKLRHAVEEGGANRNTTAWMADLAK